MTSFTETLGFAIEDFAATGEHDDVRTFAGKGFRDAQTDPGRCAADNRGLALKLKVHGCEGEMYLAPTTSAGR